MSCKVLIVVMSCYKHKHLWKEILNRGLNNLIIICGKKMEADYSYENKILYLNCNDGYEGLPEKMIFAINAILRIDEFKTYTHIMKVDDHDNKFNSSLNQRLINESNINLKDPFGTYIHDYLGQRLHTYILRNWHINKCSPSSHWNTQPYMGPNTNYLDGGSSYILTRRAMEFIQNEYNFNNIEIVQKNHIWEDLMIALTLKKYNIFPKQIPPLVIGDK